MPRQRLALDHEPAGPSCRLSNATATGDAAATRAERHTRDHGRANQQHGHCDHAAACRPTALEPHLGAEVRQVSDVELELGRRARHLSTRPRTRWAVRGVAPQPSATRAAAGHGVDFARPPTIEAYDRLSFGLRSPRRCLRDEGGQMLGRVDRQGRRRLLHHQQCD